MRPPHPGHRVVERRIPRHHVPVVDGQGAVHLALHHAAVRVEEEVPRPGAREQEHPLLREERPQPTEPRFEPAPRRAREERARGHQQGVPPEPAVQDRSGGARREADRGLGAGTVLGDEERLAPRDLAEQRGDEASGSSRRHLEVGAHPAHRPALREDRLLRVEIDGEMAVVGVARDAEFHARCPVARGRRRTGRGYQTVGGTSGGRRGFHHAGPRPPPRAA